MGHDQSTAVDYEKELNRIHEKLEAGTLHVTWCNADHEKRVGCDGCSCPLGREIKILRKENRELKQALEETNEIIGDNF